VQCFGWGGTVKAFLKLMMPRRRLYYMKLDNRIVNCGWLTSSYCRYYHVENGAVVIGPVNTDPDYRNKGIAAFAMAKAIDEMAARGGRIFYIDTSAENYPMQRVISKCGFGEPYDYYEKDQSGVKS